MNLFAEISISPATSTNPNASASVAAARRFETTVDRKVMTSMTQPLAQLNNAVSP